MNIVIQLLLSLLPQLLQWLLSLMSKGQRLSGRQLDRVSEIAWYCSQIPGAGARVGVPAGGTPPGVRGGDWDVARYADEDCDTTV